MCLGHTHSLQGLTAGILTLPYAPITHDLPTTIAWVAVCGGMAMLPDLDHRQTTVARLGGPFTELAAAAAGRLTGGHRRGTHDILLAPAAFAALSVIAQQWRPGRTFVFALALGLALKTLAAVIPGRIEEVWPGNLLLSWAGATLLANHTPPTAERWLPAAVAVGVVVHLLADAPTDEGLPLPVLWLSRRPPLKHARLRLPHLLTFETGQRFERHIVVPLTLAALTSAAGWVVLTTAGLTWTRVT